MEDTLATLGRVLSLASVPLMIIGFILLILQIRKIRKLSARSFVLSIVFSILLLLVNLLFIRGVFLGWWVILILIFGCVFGFLWSFTTRLRLEDQQVTGKSSALYLVFWALSLCATQLMASFADKFTIFLGFYGMFFSVGVSLGTNGNTIFRIYNLKKEAPIAGPTPSERGMSGTAVQPQSQSWDKIIRYGVILVGIFFLGVVCVLGLFLGNKYLWGKDDFDMIAEDISIESENILLAQEHYDSGVDALEAKDYENAVAEFSFAIDLNPDYAEAYCDRGAAYYNIGEQDLALADFNTALVLDPDLARAYANRGGLYWIMENYDLALNDLNNAIVLDANMCDAYLNRGAVYFSQDDYKQALADFTEAIRLDPNNGKAYKNRAATYIALGESSLAQADLDRAEELGY